MPRVSIWDIIYLGFGLKEKLETEEIVQVVVRVGVRVDEEKEITHSINQGQNESVWFSLYKDTGFPAMLFLGVLRSFFQGWNSNAGRWHISPVFSMDPYSGPRVHQLGP